MLKPKSKAAAWHARNEVRFNDEPKKKVPIRFLHNTASLYICFCERNIHNMYGICVCNVTRSNTVNSNSAKLYSYIVSSLYHFLGIYFCCFFILYQASRKILLLTLRMITMTLAGYVCQMILRI